MKKYTLHTLFLFLVVFTISCNKDFLDKTDPTRLAENLFYKDAAQVEQAVNGVYSTLQGIILSQWQFNEFPSDNTTFDFYPADRGQADRTEALETWTLNPNNVNVNSMYVAHYIAIYNTNNTLAKMKNTELTDDVRKVNEGQLKFLRAYLYYQLTNYFGDVILITKPLEKPADAWSYTRKSPDSIYLQIETDLNDAVNDLPQSYSPAQKGRITKGAALTLLGRVYLTRKRYAEAVNALKQVTSMGYSLLPNYADNFDPQKKNGAESVFEVQFQGGNDLGEWSNFIYSFAPRTSKGAVTGWAQSNPSGWNIPSKDIIAAYEPNDKRFEASVGMDFISPVTNVVVPYIKKYQHTHAIYGRTDDNWPVFRYADVLLMLAEAINEQSGPTVEAFGYINAVRARAGLGFLVGGLSKDGFRDAVLKERRVEVAFENWRWFDLKRTMTPAEMTAFLSAHGARERANPTVPRQGVPLSDQDYKFDAFEVLFPIPANEIIVNSKLTQNPGY